jgi:hypothetical protein
MGSSLKIFLFLCYFKEKKFRTTAPGSTQKRTNARIRPPLRCGLLGADSSYLDGPHRRSPAPHSSVTQSQGWRADKGHPRPTRQWAITVRGRRSCTTSGSRGELMDWTRRPLPSLSPPALLPSLLSLASAPIWRAAFINTHFFFGGLVSRRQTTPRPRLR